MSSQNLRPPIGPKTLNDIFFSVVDRDESRVMMRKTTAQWASLSSRNLYKHVVGVSRALLGWGLKRGDRVAILSENRPEWAIADFACLLLGAITVPIYTTLTEEQTAHVLCDSGTRAIFASTEELVQRVLAIQRQTHLEKVVGIDRAEHQGTVRMSELSAAGPDHRDEQFDAAAREIRPDDIATIIYTSGTTGTPKGVVLTHGNMASNIAAWLSRFDFHPGQLSISFLPLSHVTARNVDLGLLYAGVTLAYLPNVNQLAHTLLELKPTIMVAVPRVYEKIHAQVDQKANKIPKKWIYGCALSVGRRPPGLFENSRRHGRLRRNFYLRRRPIGTRTGRVVRRCWHSYPRRLWANGNVPRYRRKHTDGAQAGNSGATARKRASPYRRRWRNPSKRPVGVSGLLEQTG